MNFRSYQQFAEKVALEAGELLEKSKNNVSVIKTKGNDKLNLLTNIDLKSEKLITSIIKRKYPEHNIQSEESVNLIMGSDLTWIVDPLDGTRYYLRNFPDYNISIVLEYKAKLVVGIVYFPRLNELYSSCMQNGAYLNKKKITTSNTVNLKSALITAKLPKYSIPLTVRKRVFNLILTLSKSVNRVRSFSVDQYNLCLVANGGLEGFIITYQSGAKWWDVAAGILMVEEAGGKVTDMYGNKIKNRDLSKGLVASNGKIHDELLEIINSRFSK